MAIYTLPSHSLAPSVAYGTRRAGDRLSAGPCGPCGLFASLRLGTLCDSDRTTLSDASAYQNGVYCPQCVWDVSLSARDAVAVWDGGCATMPRREYSAIKPPSGHAHRYRHEQPRGTD